MISFDSLQREIRRRYRVLRHFLQSRTRYPYVRSEDLIRYLFEPRYTQMAQRYISSTNEEGEYKVIYLDGLDAPLYWPKYMPYKHALVAISEILEKSHWHFYEIQETRVREGDIVLDCGAAEGLFGISVLRKANHIYFIEPHPTFIASLQRTTYKKPNCTIIPYALGGSPGTVRLTDDSIASQVALKGKYEVQIDTIDNLFLSQNIPVDYIKADVEGMEAGLLQGAKQTIERYRPRIAITTYHDGQNPDEILSLALSFVPEYRYKFKGIAQNGNPIMLHLWT